MWLGSRARWGASLDSAPVNASSETAGGGEGEAISGLDSCRVRRVTFRSAKETGHRPCRRSLTRVSDQLAVAVAVAVDVPVSPTCDRAALMALPKRTCPHRRPYASPRRCQYPQAAAPQLDSFRSAARTCSPSWIRSKPQCIPVRYLPMLTYFRYHLIVS